MCRRTSSLNLNGLAKQPQKALAVRDVPLVSRGREDGQSSAEVSGEFLACGRFPGV
jgi:hypothetical protein